MPTGTTASNRTDGDELLTVREVAQALAVDEQTIRRWIRNGAMKCKRVGPFRLVRVTRAELMRHLTDQD